MAPDLTFARQAATYQAGIPTHNYIKQKRDYFMTRSGGAPPAPADEWPPPTALDDVKPPGGSPLVLISLSE
uniref:Uncharacterized protein n=1 Tax=Romanomermis culicivorax TaxID=13658 RepID=A0A915KPJ6_ROMCU